MLLASLTLAAALPRVVRVVSAHHGVCPASSNRVWSERVAELFARPLKLNPLARSRAQSEAEILQRAGASDLGNEVFTTLSKPWLVRFVGYPGTMRARTFGVQWGDDSRVAMLYFGSSGFYGATAFADLQRRWPGECPSR